MVLVVLVGLRLKGSKSASCEKNLCVRLSDLYSDYVCNF